MVGKPPLSLNLNHVPNGTRDVAPLALTSAHKIVSIAKTEMVAARMYDLRLRSLEKEIVASTTMDLWMTWGCRIAGSPVVRADWSVSDYSS